MVPQLFHIYAVLLLHVLALFALTDPSSGTGPDNKIDPTLEELLALPQHLIPITADEEARLIALLGPEYREVALAGLYATAAAQSCPKCGKETEFIDWIYTALARGIHSPEFILASLRAGARPEKHAHDVYCSRCGALTAFQDYTGEEGNAPHLHVAPMYDRATRTFAHSVYRRGDDVLDSEGDHTVLDSNPTPRWTIWHPLWNVVGRRPSVINAQHDDIKSSADVHQEKDNEHVNTSV